MGDGMGQLGQRLLTATEKRRIGKCQKISLVAATMRLLFFEIY